jgi:tripartite-type tricarboxylate transporter receptor subunit TctC
MSKLYGLDMVHVAYNSVANVMQDLTASRIDMSLLAAGPSMPFVASGKLKALAVTGPARLGMAANVTTFAQAGYPEYDSGFYMGLAAPASTPQAITSKISKDVIAALQTPEIKSLFENMGLRPAGESPASFAAFLEADRAEAAKRVQAANIKLD